MDPNEIDPRDFDPDEDAIIHSQYLAFLDEQEVMSAAGRYDEIALEMEIDERLIRRKMPRPAAAYMPGRRTA